MLPSLQLSVDGDERELESSEEGGGLPEERKPERSSNSYYCLYGYQGCRLSQGGENDDGSPSSTSAESPSSDDFSLSLVDTNLPPEEEMELRSYIAKQFAKGSFFEGMGNVTSVELSIPESRVGCYYCLLQPEKSTEAESLESSDSALDYVVCFLGGSEKGLELFRLELDRYVQDLKINLDSEENNLETYIKPFLRTWFEDSVCPIQRVVQLFQEKLALLLHAALSCTPVEVKDSDGRTKKDIHKFLRAASLQDLVRETTVTSLCTAMTEGHKPVEIDCSGPQLQFHNAGRNKFCEDWMQAFLNGPEGGNPFLFQQILENFKLKAIQDINNLKRFIRQAEMSHYALFKCYLFLKNCGSGDVLLKIVKVEHAEMPEAKNVISVLEEFMREPACRLNSSPEHRTTYTLQN
ncbi:protein Njmu-R1 [Anolis carolinensis]|uniref:Chromosome 17 open reading frame 75 n=1 Tax=Anolis carolinensis TaxID=28377 RepID=H9GFP8_ANOCA|nr:PREDICTED: protein Njmu-R1 [Anolis carolinensis]|eukprot:XP_003223273.1 PREDICTED: protein Njmu-R1 [Anolis carolinensis]